MHLQKVITYHSALSSLSLGKDYDEVYGIGFIKNKSMAFVHDIMNGLPDEYKECDVIYMEPPWRPGFKEYERRAKVTCSRQYKDLMGALHRIIIASSIPILVVTGRHALIFLPKPTIIYQTRFHHGVKAIAICYGLTLTSYANTISIYHELSNRFNCIGDPLCGYGNSGRAFFDKGKRFIMSDYNPSCIGAIAREFR